MPRRSTRRRPIRCPQPFEVHFASRVDRLPPYMFGRINNSLYQKRRAGDDVIDLGMGNPSDPPDPIVIQKLADAAADEGNHGYSKSNGITNLRREVASKYYRKYGVRLDPEHEVIACLGSKEGFSHMCLALMGPGDTAMIPSPYFPVHMYGVILGFGKCRVAWTSPIPIGFFAMWLTPASTWRRAEDLDRQLSAQSIVGRRRTGLLCRSRAVGKEVSVSW